MLKIKPPVNPPSRKNTSEGGAAYERHNDLEGIWKVVHRDLPQAKGAERILNKIANVQNKTTSILQPGLSAEKTLAVPVRALVDTPQISEAIRRGTSTLMEVLPPFMKVLDEVAKIHPFIQVTVLAFKAVYTLEMKRRKNDETISTLYAEMIDMMDVLLRLNDVVDSEQVMSDGFTLEGRMQKLCKGAANDITECVRTCKEYLDTTLFIKFFGGQVLEGRLNEFITRFAKRRGDFELALNIHTTIGVDTIIRKVDSATQGIGMILQLFEEFTINQQEKFIMAMAVKEMGGGNALGDGRAAEKRASAETTPITHPDLEIVPDADYHLDPAELQQETETFNHTSDIEESQVEEVSFNPADIRKRVDTFMEDVIPLLEALKEVSSIHPFISVTVLAFHTVYALEQTRRENDKRVLLLYVAMKDMVAALVRLRDIFGPSEVSPDGQTIGGRVEELCRAAAEDIKMCANVCDMYLKKRLLVKVLAGPIWEGKLLNFAYLFAKRQEEFEFALTIHTTVGVDAANLALNSIGKRGAEQIQRMDVILQLFQEYVTPNERILASLANKLGGEGALEDDQALKKLVDAEYSLTMGSGPDLQRGGVQLFDLAGVRQDIRDDPGEAIEENYKLFDRKFEVQRRQIVEELAHAIEREGDRIIGVLSAPHGRIVDHGVSSVWKDMGWRGSVKSQNFVTALCDYYAEKASGDSSSLADPNSWAVNYINIGRSRSILGAFSDNSNVFITTDEVNDFIRSRPFDWSLPHWIAYWAIGWQMTCTTYCVKIEEIFDAMIRIAYEVLPENRLLVTIYISAAWQLVTVFVQSIKREEGTEYLRSKFEPQAAAEEARLRMNLEDLKYQIDDPITFNLITGGSRVETTLFPMFYLALKRDLGKISLARKHVLSENELFESFTTVDSIASAALERIESLRCVFKQQNLEAKEQFKIFAEGLYNISSTNEVNFNYNKLRELPDPIPCGDEAIPDPDSTPLSILNYPPGKKREINFAAYDSSELTLPPAEGINPVLGVYYGFIYQNGRPADPMIKLTFTASEVERTFVAEGAHYRGGGYKSFNIIGHWSSPLEDGKFRVELRIMYRANDWTNAELIGVFDPEENSLRGTTATATSEPGEFVFKRDPDFVRFYPAPSVTNARKRWEFATKSVLDRIRRQAWSSRQILERMKDRRQYMELTLRKYYGRNLTENEEEELLSLFPRLHEADAQFYATVIDVKLTKIPIFTSIYCDNCSSTPGGSRTTCLDCSGGTTTDFCSEPECVNSTVTFEATDKGPHFPSHGMFRVYRIVFDRDMSRVEKFARHALNSARIAISQLKKEVKPMPECANCKTAVSLPCWYCAECISERFICEDCEHAQLAFDETHTEMHTVVRIAEDVEGKKLSTEERLQLMEVELTRMRQTIATLVEKNAGPEVCHS